MSSLAQRVQRLTKSTEVLEARREAEAIMEMVAHVPESNLSAMLTEKLAALPKKDKPVIEFIDTERRLRALHDMGIGTAVANIKVTEAATNPMIAYAVTQFENAVNNRVSDYLIVDAFLEAFKPYTYDKKIKESWEAIHRTRQTMDEDILVARAIAEIVNVNQNSIGFYKPVVEALENYLEGRGREARQALLRKLEVFTYDPSIRQLSNSLKMMESQKGAFEVVSNNDNCLVRPVYSFALFTAEGHYFAVDGNFYQKKGSTLRRLTVSEATALPVEFRERNQYLIAEHVSVRENTVTIALGDSKIEMVYEGENKSLSVNGRALKIEEMNDAFVRAGVMDRRFIGDVRIINNIWENLNSLFDIDFGKIVESVNDRGLRVALFRLGENMYANRINGLMQENRFFENLNGTQVRNLVLEHLHYDISESLTDFLSKENARVVTLKNKKRELLDRLEEVEANIQNIDIEINNIDEADRGIVERVREMLAEEATTLQGEIAATDQTLSDMQSVDDAPTVPHDIGDWVQAGDKGKGKIIAVDMIEGTAQVMLETGETETLPIEQITSVEDQVDAEVMDNDPNAPEPEVEVAQNEFPSEELPPAPDAGEEVEDTMTEKKSPVVTEAEAAATEPPTGDYVQLDVAKQPETVRARVAIEYPSHYRGNTVQIVAKDFTSKGDDDPIEVRLDSGQTETVPKKFLSVVENLAITGAEVEADLDNGGVENPFFDAGAEQMETSVALKDTVARLGSVLGTLQELVASLGANPNVGTDKLQDITNNVQSFMDSLNSEAANDQVRSDEVPDAQP